MTTDTNDKPKQETFTMHYYDARKLVDDREAFASATEDQVNDAWKSLCDLQKRYAWPIAADDMRLTKLYRRRKEFEAEGKADA